MFIFLIYILFTIKVIILFIILSLFAFQKVTKKNSGAHSEVAPKNPTLRSPKIILYIAISK